MNDEKTIKETVGRTAAETLVKSGMKLGLGTGTTAIFTVRHIGHLLKEGKLRNILAVPTSFQTSIECESVRSNHCHIAAFYFIRDHDTTATARVSRYRDPTVVNFIFKRTA